MTVGELKQLLEGVSDDVEVLIPLDTGVFDGYFYSPCIEDSGLQIVGDDELDEEDAIELELLAKPFGEEEFLLVPHGFFEINDDNEKEFIPELN